MKALKYLLPLFVSINFGQSFRLQTLLNGRKQQCYQSISLRTPLFLTEGNQKTLEVTPNISNVWARVLLGSIFSFSVLATGLMPQFPLPVANADRPLNAPTAAGTRVNSDADSLLRYGLPIDNKNVRDIQSAIESVKMNLKTRRINFALADANNAKSLLKKYGESIVSSMPQNHQSKGKESLARLSNDIQPLLDAISAGNVAGAGSVQERQGLDSANAAQNVLSEELSIFEELLVPDDFKREIPTEYKSLPSLSRRATVQMTISHPDGSQYDVDGKLYDNVNIKMVIDGYNAPLTGGNFVDLVQKGFYNKMKITRSDGFVVQTGDFQPEGEVHGYAPKGDGVERKVPLEIAVKGDKDLLYGVTTEDDGRGYAAAVLPFQSYGALGMARGEFEPDSASSQFFWLLFESDLTPAGKNMLDGRYACFGYTVDGADQLKAVREGDVIVAAKVISGSEYLQQGN